MSELKVSKISNAGGAVDFDEYPTVNGDPLSTAADLALTTGAAGVGANDGASGTLWTTVQGFITYTMALVVGFFTRTRVFYNAGDNGTVDRTSALAAVVATGANVRILGGQTIKVSDWIDLLDNQTVYVDSGAQINQVTADRGVFRATSKTRLNVVNNGILYGPGVWSSSWVGNGGHTERGVYFRGCTNAGVAGSGNIRNFGHAAVAIEGGSNYSVRNTLEGTNSYSQPIALNDNFQLCVYIADDTTYGVTGSVSLDCDYSGSAHGVVREHRDSGTTNGGPLKVRGHFHDIPGQHGIYAQRGNLDIDITVNTIALSAVKIQSPGTGMIVSNVRANVIGDTLGSHAFEVATLSTGMCSDMHLTCDVNNAGGGLLSMVDKAQRITADLQGTGNVLGFQAQGANQTDIKVRINGKSFGQSAVAIYSTASNFEIWPTLRESNTQNTSTDCGILINSASATVILNDPDVTDADGKMKYGLFNSQAGSVVKVRGSAKFTGGANTDVRATGDITEWPTEAIPTSIDRITNLGNIYSSQPMRFTGQSVSASNIVLLNYKMPDECTFAVEVALTGKLSGTTERATYKLLALFYRDGGGIVTKQGATQVVSSVASGSFAGAYSLQSDGASNIVLLCNSGGAATYDWMALLTVSRVV